MFVLAKVSSARYQTTEKQDQHGAQEKLQDNYGKRQENPFVNEVVGNEINQDEYKASSDQHKYDPEGFAQLGIPEYSPEVFQA